MLRNFFKRLYFGFILKHHAIKHDLWMKVCGKIPLFQGLSVAEKTLLRELSSLFLYQKKIIGIKIPVTDEMRVVIAAQACLPVLALGIESLNGWRDVIIYPDTFCVSRDEQDNSGIVHHKQFVLSGEAWLKGPLVLSWEAVKQGLKSTDLGHNVIIHEIAHKLDMLNGRANGMPPLHLNMQIQQWTESLNSAYQLLNHRIENHHKVYVNPYAATNPAEFFAVFSEYFFSAPNILVTHFPAVYEQLRLYYRQNPKQRLESDK